MAFDPSRLLVILQNTGLQNKDQALYQLLFQLIKALAANTSSISEIIDNSSTTNNVTNNVTNQQLVISSEDDKELHIISPSLPYWSAQWNDHIVLGFVNSAAIARFKAAEIVTAHAHYAFLDVANISNPAPGLFGNASFNASTTISGTQDIDHKHDFQSASLYSGSGILSVYAGYQTQLRVSAGTTSELNGIRILDPTKTGGTITLNAALRIFEQTAGSTNYAIYSTATQESRIGGPLWLNGSGSILTVSGFGTHAFSASGVGGNVITLTNTIGVGTANFSRFALGNDLGLRGFFTLLSSTFASAGINTADGIALVSTGTGGATFGSTNAAGTTRIYALNIQQLNLGAVTTQRLGGAGSGFNIVESINTTAGTVNGARISCVTDAGANRFAFSGFSTTWTVVDSVNLADAMTVFSAGVGGLTIAATDSGSGGNVRVIARGTASSNIVVTFGANQNILIGAATAPGTGSNGIVYPDGTAFSSMGSNTAGDYADDVGGTVERFAINEANEVARLTGLICRNSAQFDKTNTTLADVTGLSRNVSAGNVFEFEAHLFVDADVTGGSKFAISGTATATSIKYYIELLDDTTNTFTIVSRQTALAGSAGQAGTISGRCIIRGTIVVNAAGTLTVQFAQNVASGTSSILSNSTFKITRIG